MYTLVLKKHIQDVYPPASSFHCPSSHALSPCHLPVKKSEGVDTPLLTSLLFSRLSIPTVIVGLPKKRDCAWGLLRYLNKLTSSMGSLLPTLELIFRAFRAVTAGRYSLTAAYTVLFYDWIISLDKEVEFIHRSKWNAVKIAYLFCRYYPLSVAPFLFWGFLGNHEKSVCQLYYHALYACVVPTMLSAQFILMLRSYAFTGRRRSILAALSISFVGLVGYVMWVVIKELNLTALFLIKESSGCFATSNQPNAGILRMVGAYQLGLISMLTAFFDCLNMFIVIWHCVRQRSTLGPLGQSFLKQGLLVYVIMTALNALTIGTYFTNHMLYQAQGSWFAYILPSPLACRLVLLLRRKARPTETELHIQYSHMIDEALEMAAVQRTRVDTMSSSIPPVPPLPLWADPQAEA